MLICCRCWFWNFWILHIPLCCMIIIPSIFSISCIKTLLFICFGAYFFIYWGTVSQAMLRSSEVTLDDTQPIKSVDSMVGPVIWYCSGPVVVADTRYFSTPTQSHIVAGGAGGRHMVLGIWLGFSCMKSIFSNSLSHYPDMSSF